MKGVLERPATSAHHARPRMSLVPSRRTGQGVACLPSPRAEGMRAALIELRRRMGCRRAAALAAVDQEFAARMAAAQVTARPHELPAIMARLMLERAARKAALRREFIAEQAGARRRLKPRRRAIRRRRRGVQALAQLTLGLLLVITTAAILPVS